MNLDPAIVTIARLAIGGLLLYAAVHKLSHMLDFRLALGAYQLVPLWAVTPMAYGFALAETGLAVACLAQVPEAFLGAFALLAIYTAAIAVNLARGMDSIDCGCGGPPQPLSFALVVRNALLLSACVAAASTAAVRELVWVDGLTIALGVGVLVLLYATMNQLLVSRGGLQGAGA